MKLTKHNVTKQIAKGTIAGALGLSAIGLGVGAGVASADPWQPCWQHDCQGDDHHSDQWRPDQYGYQRSWDQRGIDDARFDHQPFNWQGQRVEPYWDAAHNAWGFWAFGVWIPL